MFTAHRDPGLLIKVPHSPAAAWCSQTPRRLMKVTAVGRAAAVSLLSGWTSNIFHSVLFGSLSVDGVGNHTRGVLSVATWRQNQFWLANWKRNRSDEPFQLVFFLHIVYFQSSLLIWRFKVLPRIPQTSRLVPKCVS